MRYKLKEIMNYGMERCDNLIYGKYGEYYDLIYSMKNYDSECKGLIGYFKKFSRDKVRNVLDVGCGTGNHCTILAEKGYRAVGIDFSEVMIAQAKKRSRGRVFPWISMSKT